MSNRQPAFLLTDSRYGAMGSVTIENGRYVGRDTSGRDLFNVLGRVDNADKAAIRKGMLLVTSSWYNVPNVERVMA